MGLDSGFACLDLGLDSGLACLDLGLDSGLEEPLAELINSDINIIGIGPKDRGKNKILQYADDINILVKTKEELNRVMKHINTYVKVSGAKVNKNKSEITFYGKTIMEETKWGFKSVQGVRKAQGVYIGHNMDEADEKTWN